LYIVFILFIVNSLPIFKDNPEYQMLSDIIINIFILVAWHFSI